MIELDRALFVIQKRGQIGFTLIELMVTIAVLAIIAALAAPSFQSMRDNQKLKLSLMEMRTGIQQGRSRAIIARSPTLVCPDTVAEVTCGANIANYASLSQSQKDDSVLRPVIDDSVTIKSGSVDHFIFNPQGITVSGTITLCSGNKSVSLTVNGPGVITQTDGGVC